MTFIIVSAHECICHAVHISGRVGLHGPVAGPLFQFHDGRFLIRARFVVAVRLALVEAGLDARLYSGQFQNSSGDNSGGLWHTGFIEMCCKAWQDVFVCDIVGQYRGGGVICISCASSY